MTPNDIIHNYEIHSNPTGPDGDPKEGCFLAIVLLILCIGLGAVVTHCI